MRIDLGEGNTPLIPSRHIGPKAGLSNLFFKLETVNPTGSYKDRFAAAAISDMLSKGETECIGTSSGNTGAAMAAYCAAANIRCRIAIVETAPKAKIMQMLAYGAEVFRIKEFGLEPDITDAVFRTLQRQGAEPGRALQISAYSFSPVGMSGVETISHELRNQLPDIDHVFCPTGGGGLALAVKRGYGKTSPAIHVVQPEGNNTIVGPFRQGSDKAQEIICQSQISGLQIASVIDGNEVIAECRPTGGDGHLVTDEQVWNVQGLMAREEGIFAEPAGAVALAGALQAAENGEFALDSKVVCLVTGSGFKDVPSVERMTENSPCPLVDLEELENA